MARISVGDGMWFDMDKAEQFNEGRDWDGRNHISRATGSQWEHETLYRTAKGKWVLNSSSAWQGSRDAYRIVDGDEACAWLIAQGENEAAERYFPAQVAESEV